MNKKELHFECIEDFIEKILDRVYDNEGLGIDIVAKFDEMVEMVKMIMLLEECVDFEIINLTSPIINDYSDEYVMDVFLDCKGVFFNVQPAKNSGHYINVGNDEIYVFDSCHNRILDECKLYDTYIVHIDDEDDSDLEADTFGTTAITKCGCSKCKTSSGVLDKSGLKYYVNGEAVSKKEYDIAYGELEQMLKEVMGLWIK